MPMQKDDEYKPSVTALNQFLLMLEDSTEEKFNKSIYAQETL